MLTSTLIINLSFLGAGLIAGYFLAYALRPVKKGQKELESRLAEAQNELNSYEKKVTDHFRGASKSLSNLSQSYEGVLEHLASGALHLANADVGRQIAHAGLDSKKGINLTSDENLSPPKDYAPKAPGGVLSEEYGLKETKVATDIQHAAHSGSDYASEEADDDPTLNIN